MKEKMSVKTIVAIGIGSAVFVILGPNTNLETSYPFLALMSVVFGPVAGGLIGLIGHTLKDFTTYGSAWWSWIICSGIIGIIFGFAGRKMDLQHGEFTTNDMVRFNIFQAFGNIVVWGLIAPSLDILIYSVYTRRIRDCFKYCRCGDYWNIVDESLCINKNKERQFIKRLRNCRNNLNG